MTTNNHLQNLFPQLSVHQLDNYIENMFPKRIRQTILPIEYPNYTLDKGKFITGDYGKGKTIMAAFYLLSAIKKESDFNKCLFIGTADLLFLLKQSYEKHTWYSETDILNQYSTAKALVLDDIGIEKINDWSFQMLYLVVNRRYENCLPTIFTSNYTLQELYSKMSDGRIPRRIEESCDVIHLQ